jgi:hypothetical protein
MVDHYVTGPHQRQQGVADCRHTPACCQRSLQIRPDVIAAGYLAAILEQVLRRTRAGLGVVGLAYIVEHGLALLIDQAGK